MHKIEVTFWIETNILNMLKDLLLLVTINRKSFPNSKYMCPKLTFAFNQATFDT